VNRYDQWWGRRENQPCIFLAIQATVLTHILSASITGVAIMGRFSSFLLGVVVGAVAVYGSLKYHVVRAQDGVHLVPKVYSGLGDVYVDIRNFAPSDWNRHRALALALVKADKEDLIGDTTAGFFRQSLQNALEGLTGEGT
jgi:hypothetical protein